MRDFTEKEMENVFIPFLGVGNTNTFSTLYPAMNWWILQNEEWQKSRDGNVKELLDVKTHITNPYRRCTGGYNRNINIFFLLAEAMWIACGRKDVEFLTIFNEKMKNYSDDGNVFHAPYGFRLRNWGIESENNFVKESSNKRGYDQIIDSIRLLSENPNSRQVVVEIWNPVFDLGFKTKDIPCNDIIMFKIRNKKLITTIANRSNDLHFGLPTNVFQFSFLTELIASSLGIELGTQTHNSQSLHIYQWNKIADVMNECYINKTGKEMYKDCRAQEKHIDFNFSHDVPVNRFREIEINLNIIINNLMKISKNLSYDFEEISSLKNFSKYLYEVFNLLKIYISYKNKLKSLNTDKEKDQIRRFSISLICDVEKEFCNDSFNWDISMLAKNFFFKRLVVDKIEHEFLGSL